jgi:hypothetical protein
VLRSLDTCMPQSRCIYSFPPTSPLPYLSSNACLRPLLQLSFAIGVEAQTYPPGFVNVQEDVQEELSGTVVSLQGLDARGRPLIIVCLARMEAQRRRQAEAVDSSQIKVPNVFKIWD